MIYGSENQKSKRAIYEKKEINGLSDYSFYF